MAARFDFVLGFVVLVETRDKKIGVLTDGYGRPRAGDVQKLSAQVLIRKGQLLVFRLQIFLFRHDPNL